ncbi:hypothetical protein [Kitasatospora sp. NPDC002965]|uniref:hypothetical protein n=1 Tax=Kitasatospora sp. NPDC002965 TaxID=3154775 RepID=UPI0033AC0D20
MALSLSLGGTAACSSTADTTAAPVSTPPLSTTPTATTPVPTSSAPDPTADAKEGALAAYRGMWTVTVKAYGAGSLNGVDDLEAYMADKALAGFKVAVAYYDKNNMVVKGKPLLVPQVQTLDLAGKPSRVTIRDCVDTSNFQPVDRTTGQPSATDGKTRHVMNAVTMFLDGKWLVTDAAYDREQTC